MISDAAAWAPLGRRGRASLLADVARGLSALHAAGYAHLDLKSHNVLVDSEGSAEGGGGSTGSRATAVLCDFGGAYPVASAEGPPAEGTSGWTAPEILEPPTLRPDARLADIFSFGILVWAVVSGPSGAENPLCGLAGEDCYEPLRTGVRPSFSSELETSEEAKLAATCWSFDAASRPKLADVLRSLEELSLPAPAVEGAKPAAADPQVVSEVPGQVPAPQATPGQPAAAA
eukprot:CAMPEP_0183516122 /NCGR_PEP_ID=MMETSP0371-20130417/13967_1 /TAXON_ID=268820 /ORGANISM="Peridinium aciculiferum, Strain PAER-2" /LENGTH=230 /DNA_ID=CAMNT_0025713793 /DNA_START=53 /DNA_END=745 /DNA_ORIENTATION=-